LGGTSMKSATRRKFVRTRREAERFRPRLLSLEDRSAPGSLLTLGFLDPEPTSADFQFDPGLRDLDWHSADIALFPTVQDSVALDAGPGPAGVSPAPIQQPEATPRHSLGDVLPSPLAFDLAMPGAGSSTLIFVPSQTTISGTIGGAQPLTAPAGGLAGA